MATACTADVGRLSLTPAVLQEHSQKSHKPLVRFGISLRKTCIRATGSSLHTPKPARNFSRRKRNSAKDGSNKVSLCHALAPTREMAERGMKDELTGFYPLVDGISIPDVFSFRENPSFLIDFDHPEGGPSNVLSALETKDSERNLLENHFILSSVETTGEGCDFQGGLALENVAISSRESKGRNIVRKRNFSARQRRLSSRSKDAEADFCQFNGDVLKVDISDIPQVDRDKNGTGDATEYVNSFLNEIGKARLLTKDEELVLSLKVREIMELTNAKRRLWELLGREPTIAEWAEDVKLKQNVLRRKMTDGTFARQKLIFTNLRLVVSVAKKYTTQAVELSDLITAGSTGLARGIDKFDPSRGYKLSTYVHWWIRQAIVRSVADHCRTVRLPVHVHETLGRIRKAKSKLVGEGQTASTENIASALGVSQKKIRGVMKLKYKTKSMDENVRSSRNPFDDGMPRHTLVADEDAETRPWESLHRETLERYVEDIFEKQLDVRERNVISLHFGIGDQHTQAMSLDRISQRFGVSRERIRQVETVAMRRLKSVCAEKELHHYCFD